MREQIDVSVWESHIRFGSQSYKGTVGPFDGRDLFSNVQ